MSKTWSFLKPNDVVDIIAPASNAPSGKLEEGVKWFESVGLRTHVPKDLIQTDLFFAAPLSVQLEHITHALYSDSKAIWCLRGGYGSMRLVPYLMKMKPPKRPKLFIGFSDITSLHLFFSEHWGWPTIHGRTVSQLNPEFSKVHDVELLKKIIFGKKKDYTFKNLTPLNQKAEDKKSLKGKITGGNLRIIQSSLSTDWELNPRGKIVYIEDVGERGYSVHRMLEQLIQAKLLDKGVKAVVFGDFTESLERDGRNLVWDAIERFADKVPYPVLKGLPAGHGHETNYPVPFNTQCLLKLGKKGSLFCNYGGGN